MRLQFAVKVRIAVKLSEHAIGVADTLSAVLEALGG